jgi:hypothetical protein
MAADHTSSFRGFFGANVRVYRGKMMNDKKLAEYYDVEGVMI